MGSYHDDVPESTRGDWPGERWTLTDADWALYFDDDPARDERTDFEEYQQAREALDRETFPVPDDGCDPPAYDDDYPL
jgi:hypothetical protein